MPIVSKVTRVYDLLIILPNKYLCNRLTDSTELHNFLCRTLVFMQSAQPTSPRSPLSCYNQKSVGKLWFSLFWVTCVLRAEVSWLAAALECMRA